MLLLIRKLHMSSLHFKNMVAKACNGSFCFLKSLYSCDVRFSGVNGSLRGCSSDDLVAGHGGQNATSLWHKAIPQCISAPVKIRTSCLNSHFMAIATFILRCCIVNIKGICRHDALPYS